jgi:hypothetical protein
MQTKTSLLPWIAVLASLGLAPAACKLSFDDARSEEESDTKKSRKKSKKPKDDDDDESSDEKKATSKSDDAAEIDIDAFFSGKEASGGANMDVSGIEVSTAPALRRRGAASPELAGSQWLLLPGDRLEIPNPRGWDRTRKQDVGLLTSPDKKGAVVFSTVRTTDDMQKVLRSAGEVWGVTRVRWMDPKNVRLGEDDIPAKVWGGAIDIAASVKHGRVMLTLIETGSPDKVMAVVLMDGDAPRSVGDTTVDVLLATRKARR